MWTAILRRRKGVGDGSEKGEERRETKIFCVRAKFFLAAYFLFFSSPFFFDTVDDVQKIERKFLAEISANVGYIKLN